MVTCKNCKNKFDKNNGIYCPECGTKYETGKQTAQVEQQPINQPTKTNTMSIVGFVLSFFISLAGLILSIVGLVQIKRTHEGGKGLAIAGIVISAVKMVVGIVTLVFGMIFMILGISIAGIRGIFHGIDYDPCSYAYNCEYDEDGIYMCTSTSFYGEEYQISCPNEETYTKEEFLDKVKTIYQEVKDNYESNEQLKTSDQYKYVVYDILRDVPRVGEINGYILVDNTYKDGPHYIINVDDYYQGIETYDIQTFGEPTIYDVTYDYDPVYDAKELCIYYTGNDSDVCYNPDGEIIEYLIVE